MSILIVDDSKNQRQLLQHHLKKDGFSDVILAASAKEAFEHLGLESPNHPTTIDLILMDIMMPEINGIEACRCIKATEYLRDIPIIMVTGTSDLEKLESAFAAGAVDYIVKPAKKVELLARVRSSLRLKHEMDRRKAQEQELIREINERKRTEMSLQQRNRELALLNKVGQLFNSTLEWNQVLETVLTEICRLLHIMAASFWVRIPETEELVCQQATGPESASIIGWRLAQGEGIVGQAAQTGEIINVADSRTDTRYYTEIDRKTGREYRSNLSIPFWMQDVVIGVLNLVDTEVGRFGEAELRLVQPIAAIAASAVRNAQLYLLAQRQKEEAEKSREIAEAANQKILKSIRYAQMIQSSLLPNMEQIKERLPESFFLWMPRDIIGGDIYFVEFCENGFLIAVMDCTGHGVPGAFMTMIASSGIRRIIKDEACSDPAVILQRLNVIVKTTLRQDTEFVRSDDGLDAAVCFVQSKNRLLTFAGARLPLYYVHNGDVTMIEGDKQSVGYKRSDVNFGFTNQTVVIQPNMRFYLTTDGFVDQLGGEKGLPFGKKRFKALLKEQCEYTFEQQDNLVQVFNAYKGKYDRQDDVTVVGFGIPEP